ncbi:MAG TPA: tetratricopeptide repeat protein [Thermoguttaceae bacterium]|nr:tetratricopeptide repeat protein [Thermoguttaceae bacterium]
MSRRIIPLILLVVFTSAWTAAARAENEGLADLDRATALKIKAQQQSELNEAIDLFTSALKKGLDEENTRFAKLLLASALCERATLASDAAFARGPADPLWTNYRTLALEDLEKAVEIVPELPDALLVIARLHRLPGGDRRRAASAVESALAVQGVDPRVRARFLMLAVEMEEDQAKKLKRLDEAVELSGSKIEPLRARGMLHVAMGHAELAAADFARVLELDPENVETYEEQAQVLIALRRFDQALVSVDKASELAPGSVMPLAIRSQIHAEMGNLEAAMHDLKQALALRPGNTYLLLLRADVYKKMNDLDAALDDVTRVLRQNPDLPQARNLRWSVLLDQRKLGQVISEMEEQLERTPGDQDTLIQVAMLYTAQKQPKKAVEIYSKVLAGDADNLEALQGRANALLGVGKHAEAVADFNRAMKLDPNDSNSLNNLAWVLATSPNDSLRDGPRAVTIATRACKLTDYHEAHILSTLAAAYAESGDFDAAVKWSTKAAEAAKNDKETDASVRESLKKELQSYRRRQPWRERLDEGLRPVDSSR